LGFLLKYCFPLFLLASANCAQALQANPDTAQITQLCAQARAAILRNSYDSAISMNNRALDLARRINFTKGLASVYNNRGLLYYYKTNYPLALENWKKAMPYYVKLSKLLLRKDALKGKKGMSSMYGNIGVIYNDRGDYPIALDYYLKSLKMDEELDDKKSVAATTSNIGLLYMNMRSFEKSLTYNFKALKLARQLGDSVTVANILGNIGGTYSEMQRFSKGLNYSLAALNLNEQAGNERLVANNLGNIGIIYSQQGHAALMNGNVKQAKSEFYPKALGYYLRALEICYRIDDKAGSIADLLNIGSDYSKQNKHALALTYLLKAQKTALETGSMRLNVTIEGRLYEVYKNMGNANKALEHHEIYFALRDSLYAQEKQKEIVSKELNYSFDKEKAIAQTRYQGNMEKQKAVSEEKNRRQQVVTLIVAGGLVLVLVFSFLILRSLRLTRKQKVFIEEQKVLVEKQKHLVEEKQKEIIDSIRYAKRIQNALMRSEKQIQRDLNDHKK
jgi:tetratricopeptide (TPR) repeat protein